MGRKIMATKLVHNVETGEVSEVELTTAELSQVKADKAEQIAEAKEAKAKEDNKAELLARLGITAEEAALLLG
jgi:predicted type IV restriction endonuclease